MNACPICNQPAVLTCRCPRSDSECKNGHWWYCCLAHNEPRIVLGKSDHGLDLMTCVCKKEEKSDG